ncbi:hypothetical protein CK203_088006 [Vitis vinifera]|uniref:Reverse transcriptase zinc-binding domain-containing protein n=1 Tax=Vitis vinifera TaxID=29760 RepID=A0A438ER87_VITVI|nr:hypothetical protein CK203_088006 [Vitis vinifera]
METRKLRRVSDVKWRPSSTPHLSLGCSSFRQGRVVVAVAGCFRWNQQLSFHWQMDANKYFCVSIGSKDNKKGKSITPSCSWKAIAQVSQEFSKFTRFVVGDGERIRFWEDLWWGDQPLGVQYPRLFRVVIDKNIPISSILSSTRPFSWNFNFRRNLSDSEIEDLGGLMRSLDRLHLSPSVSDKRS